MKSLKELVSDNCITLLRDSISAARGNEVFFLCSTVDGLVTSARPLARGNESAVPAIVNLARFGDVVIHNHPSGVLNPSNEDISAASSLADRGIGFYIVNNHVSDIYVVVEPFRKEAPSCLDEGEIDGILGPGGVISGRLPGYEVRDSQMEMAREVARALNSDRLLLVEAGTGVGKSMAYLIPSILWAVRNKERVVVSTNTINLQEQLSRKDIPFLQSAMGVDFKAVLVKGRGNYACIRKAREVEKEPSLFPEGEERKAIIEWLRKTRDGSLSDLGFTPKPEVWEDFASEADTCLRLRCEHFSECFFNKARREAASADILIANHHLLFSDLAIRAAKADYSEAAVLPPYSRVIIDEAHNMEDVATSYFGDMVSRGGVLKQLGRLRHRRERRKGLLPFIAAKVSRLEYPMDNIVTLINGELSMTLEDCSHSVSSTFDTLHYLFSSLRESREPELRVRIDEVVKGNPGWEEVSEEVRNCIKKMGFLVKGLRGLNSEMARGIRGNEMAEKELLPQMVEVKAMADRLEALSSSLENILFGEGNDSVRWVEVREGKGARPPRVTLYLSPLHVGATLNTSLYSNFRTVVMTSATLSIREGFGFIKGRIGLDSAPEGRVKESLLPSPFDFFEQALLCLVTDLPDPKEEKYADTLPRVIPDAINASDGSTLTLFTSYSLMNTVYERCRDTVQGMGYSIMRQGDAPRHGLLERFKRGETSVLFGTESFWEGVDVPGEALRQVIITRLPFSVPDDPVAQARQEEIERKGGNPFREYLLPSAVIRFRQGFGRLIRTKRDRGVVLVLDVRAARKSYGKTFLKSIPECRVVKGEVETVIKEIGAFLRGKGITIESV
jgi:ATP-dependent DNA helicase DinG